MIEIGLYYMENRERIKIIINKYSWVFSMLLSAFAIYMLLLFSGMAWNGKYLLLRGDGFEQFMGDIQMVTRSIINHENPLYQFCLSMGFSSVLPIALEVINPFNILYLIFHESDFNQITIIITILKFGVIGASFHLFARKICKTDVFWATIFSLFYSMSAFPVLYGTVYIFWLDVLYIIPLCAIAVNKALYEKKSSLLTIVFSYIFITQFYMGYLTGIFGFLYYFILLFTNHDKFKKKEIIHSVIRFAISAVNAILIAGFVWIPVLVFLLKYNPSDRTAFSDPQIGLLEVVNNLFWGEVQTAGWAPYIYCGIPCLLLLMLFFLNRKILIRDKIAYGVFLLFFVLGCFLIPLYRLLHGFDAPDSYNYRFSFIISFIVCAIACKQIVYISDIKKKYLCIWVVFLMAIYLLEGRLERFEIGDASSNTGSKLIVNLVFILLWSGVLLVFRKKIKTGRFFNLLVLIIALFEVVSNGYAGLNSYGVLQLSGIQKNDYYAWKKECETALQEINSSNDLSFYRLVVFGDYLHNSDSYFGYNGISDFCTGENEKLRHLMEDLGLYTSKAETYATGMTPSLEMLLSVKDELYLNINSRDEEKSGKPEIKAMEYYLPLGYMVGRDALEDIPMGMNAFENHNDLIQTLSGIGDIYEPVEKEKIEFIENGLTLSADKKSIMSSSDEGQMFVIVRDETAPVYIQFEQEKREEYGIAFMPFPNMVCNSDAYVSFPITVRLTDYDSSTKYVEICSYDDFAGIISFDNINIYHLNEKKLMESYSVLSQNVLNVEEWKNGFVKGTIDVTDNNKVLLTTIPLIEGWTVLVNGKKIEPLGAINGTFIAISFPGEGHYSVDFIYECPGLKLGMAVSIAGILFYIIGIFVKKRIL